MGHRCQATVRRPAEVGRPGRRRHRDRTWPKRFIDIQMAAESGEVSGEARQRRARQRHASQREVRSTSGHTKNYGALSFFCLLFLLWFATTLDFSGCQLSRTAHMLPLPIGGDMGFSKVRKQGPNRPLVVPYDHKRRGVGLIGASSGVVAAQAGSNM